MTCGKLGGCIELVLILHLVTSINCGNYCGTCTCPDYTHLSGSHLYSNQRLALASHPIRIIFWWQLQQLGLDRKRLPGLSALLVLIYFNKGLSILFTYLIT